MNFLAHLCLSGNNPKLMVGNFIGDFVKGRNALAKFDREIAAGIELHRAIDAFTDTHPVVTESKNRLRPKYRHYSGVIVDIFYDHFLAKNWKHYHQQPLGDYAQDAYKTIRTFEAILPSEVKGMLAYMISGNWLVSYATVAGINQALTGMSRRTIHESKMEEAAGDLVKHYEAFGEEFQRFFPTLITHCDQKKTELAQAGHQN